MKPEFDFENVGCDNVLVCLYSLSKLDKKILDTLSDGEEYRSSELAEKLDRDQSTVYRSLERLVSCGMVYKEKKTIRKGGYYYLYSARPQNLVKEEAMKCLDDWYDKMKGAIDELD
ncbi:MAG: helix-turn-helix domain-containing protein [Thermoplasmatota archaeon]